jgi:hypothetical protein
MIQHCSRNSLFDGVMSMKIALRVSTVDDPALCMAALIGSGLVEQLPDGRVKIVAIDEHLPSPSVRDAAAATKVRTRRWRKHKNGDHSDCLAENCEHASRDEPGDASLRERERAREQEVLPPEKNLEENASVGPVPPSVPSFGRGTARLNGSAKGDLGSGANDHGFGASDDDDPRLPDDPDFAAATTRPWESHIVSRYDN